MIDISFINRCNELFEEEGNFNVKHEKERHRKRVSDWNEKNRDYLRECIKNYSKTEKGKIARFKTVKKRKDYLKSQIKELTTEELQAIQKFYQDTPQGLHVDHIIPLSKGGRHHISNLQYLKPEENWKKHVSLDWKPTPAQP